MDIPKAIKVGVNTLLRKTGYYVTRVEPAERQRDEVLEDNEAELWRLVEPYTLTSPEAVAALVRAVEYVAAASIPGDFVECGVWKGGSAMAIANTLMRLGHTGRNIYLFDTFEAGWPEPAQEDVTIHGETPQEVYERQRERGLTDDWFCAPVDGVRDAMRLTGYPEASVHLVKGRVEDTVPGQAPETIALLRLDTDWYVSTRHELVHLYPRLSKDGVLIVDDYGTWKGARKATDDYLKTHDIAMLLNRVDDSGCRIGVKP